MKVWIFGIGLVLLLGACAEPKLDGSSQETMRQSIETITETLPAEKAEAFREATKVLLFSEVDMKSMFRRALQGEDGEDLGAEMAAKGLAKLDGMTVNQVIAEAEKVKGERRTRQRKILEGEVTDLEAEMADMLIAKEKYDALQSEIAKIQVSKTKLYWRKDRWRDNLVIEVAVTNGLDKAISRLFMQGTLATPGRSVPWLVEDFNYSVAGGLEPGESQSWSLKPNRFSGDWKKAPKDRDDVVFTVIVEDAYDAEGNPMFDTGYDAEKFERLADKLKSKRSALGELAGV